MSAVNARAGRIELARQLDRLDYICVSSSVLAISGKHVGSISGLRSITNQLASLIKRQGLQDVEANEKKIGVTCRLANTQQLLLQMLAWLLYSGYTSTSVV